MIHNLYMMLRERVRQEENLSRMVRELRRKYPDIKMDLPGFMHGRNFTDPRAADAVAEYYGYKIVIDESNVLPLGSTTHAPGNGGHRARHFFTQEAK